jgi:fructose-bisphosphate aldolase class I
MNVAALESVAEALVSQDKGILAADESMRTITKRFDAIGVASTAETRRAYREMLFTTPGIGDYVSGVILFDETIRQTSGEDGIPFPDVLQSAGIVPGIKVDLGTAAMGDSPVESVTEGLDGLAGRLAEYYKLGARFAKWRAVIAIGDGIPTDACLVENAKRLAAYAYACQEADIVPIVEPEVLMDGAHSPERCLEVTIAAQTALFAALKKARVVLSGLLLKPNMIVPGMASGIAASAEHIADATLSCLNTTVPNEVPGIVFLSGGQSEQEATAHLNAINQRKGDAPWRLSFSYGRALQASALKAWAGKPEQVKAGQEAFLRRARLNSLACRGEYSPEME